MFEGEEGCSGQAHAVDGVIVSEVAVLFAGDDEEFAALAGVAPELAARARDVACGFLRVLVPHGGPEAEAVLLVVSELVTNAVRHGGGLTDFGLEAGQGTVTVLVQDASCQPPRRLPFDRARPGGFGWLMVRELALNVQVSIGPSGKTVSAVLPLP
ncbi:ATP-binding protein [Streptomyces pseudovenezuelae]|uniref:ATP-binding protein n=1 Tax=Streptomyces pseudovenezuelae TaxID=67350 RepID=UPI0037F9F2BF